MTPSQRVADGLAPFGVGLNEEQLEKLNTYSNFLIEYSQKVNLTAITDPDEIAVKHFVDSAAVLGLCELSQGCSVIDVGTGAGFPGVVLKVARPDLRLTLLDSLQKRLEFLRQLSERLGQRNDLVHARAEIAGATPALRERFDVACARAVAQLAVLCEYCLPLVKPGGKMLALKGPDCADELAAAQNAIRLLGGRALEPVSYRLPDGSGRTLIVIEKISQTPTKYPRQRVKLTEKPL